MTMFGEKILHAQTSDRKISCVNTPCYHFVERKNRKNLSPKCRSGSNYKTKCILKAETFQNHIMRLMTNNRLRIQTLLVTNGVNAVISLIKSKTLKLHGHVKRNHKMIIKNMHWRDSCWKKKQRRRAMKVAWQNNQMNTTWS